METSSVIAFLVLQLVIVCFVAYFELQRRTKKQTAEQRDSQPCVKVIARTSVKVIATVTNSRKFARRDIDGGVPFVQYKIETRTSEDNTHVAWRRYREFERFRKVVSRHGARTTTFPRKSTLAEALSKCALSIYVSAGMLASVQQ